jgi:hypothetical protein
MPQPPPWKRSARRSSLALVRRALPSAAGSPTRTLVEMVGSGRVGPVRSRSGSSRRSAPGISVFRAGRFRDGLDRFHDAAEPGPSVARARRADQLEKILSH